MNNGMQAIMDAILQQQMRPKQLEVDEMRSTQDPAMQQMTDMQRGIINSMEEVQFKPKK